MLSNTPSRIIGAVLAGGRSRRFGSDKALAEWRDKPLIEHAIAALAPWCARVVVVGRDWPGSDACPDRPAPGLGPLGGIAGALRAARDSGYGAALTIACDTPVLPATVARDLCAGGSRRCAEVPVIGCWTVALLPGLDRWLAAEGDRSVRRWADAAGVRAIAPGVVIANVNTPADLAAL